MQTFAGRIKGWAGWLVLLGLLFRQARAQQTSTASPTPDTSTASSSPEASPGAGAPSATSSPSANADSGSAADSSLDYLYNHKAQDGSAAKEAMDANQQAKTDALSEDAVGSSQIEDPEMKLRFEKYLGSDEAPSDQIQAYLTQVHTVLDLLQARRTADAWQQLYALAKFQGIDAGVSWELANRIDSIWNANATNYQTARENDDLKKAVDTADYNVDAMSDDIKDKEIEYQRKLNEASGKGQSGSGSNSAGRTANAPAPSPNGSGGADAGLSTAPPSDQLLGKLQLTEEYLTSLQAQAQIKMNQMKIDKLFDQAKSDFADYITTLYKSGRYQHVIMAAQFWRQIFNQGEYPVAMAQQVNASLEINNEIITTIDVFNHDMDEKNVADATSQLQQAFVLSPFNPSVLGVPLARKAPVKQFSDELSRMQNMIQARDFTNLESILAKIKNTAGDFDSTKARAIVDSVKLGSQLKLGKAKLDAQQGDLKQAEEDFQAAAEAWPGNPDLQANAANFFTSEDAKTQSIAEFDRLIAENNYRAISDKQLSFAPALKDDPKRLDALKAALGKVMVAEAAVQKATLMESNGDVDGAWETVQLATKDLPDDIKLNSLRGDLAGKGADFVSAINKAQDAEKRQDLGYSLSWYAVAQREYPASQIANDGIDRISKTILSKAAL